MRKIFIYFWLLLALGTQAFADEPIDYGDFVIYDDEWILDHEDCGTEEDPNYSAAYGIACRAIDKVFFEQFASFPSPIISEYILNLIGKTAFYSEGSISWDSDTRGVSYETLTRTLKKAVEIDVPCYIDQGEDKPGIYPPQPAFEEEERTFSFYKDYSVFPSFFHTLEQDLLLVHRRDKAFLSRRMRDYYNYYTGHVPLKIKDLSESMEYCDKTFKYDSQQLEKSRKKATLRCKQSLDYCIRHHDDPLAHVNRGLFDYLDGDTLKAIDRVEQALAKATSDDLVALAKNALIIKGRSELEAGLYADAVLTLSDLIDRYPKYTEAYLERASAYFELGNFDLCLEDYLNSELSPEPSVPQNAEQFALGLTKGILQGGLQAGIEYIPSLLSSLQGLGHGLWAFAKDPVHVTSTLVEAAKNCIQFVKEHTAQETLAELAPELKELFEGTEPLKDERQGEIIGCVIGKYGVDIFAGAGLTKGMKHYRELKQANNLLTFEAMNISQRNKDVIKLEAAKRVQTRKDILQNTNLTIQADKQGKHLVGNKNYEPSKNKSILEHPDPQKLVDKYAGKGIKDTNHQPGIPGYKEIVNFEEVIGYVVDKETGIKTATTWGKIHYAKEGVHIVPTMPRKK